MENVEIAERLNEMADLLEIREANPFRVRAYRNAARTVGGLTRPVAEMVEEGEDLRELPDVGEDIAGYIEEMCTSGRFPELDRVRQEVPPTLADLLRLEGLGPKGAAKLWNELEVTSLDDLEEALERGAVQELKGFGEKSARKIGRAVEELRERGDRFRLSEADQLVRPLVEQMGEAPGIERLDVAGSYRRRRETVGDVDLLAVGDDPGAVMDHLTSFDGIERVEATGDTRGTVVLRSGLQVDLRLVPAEPHGAAMVYFTGSKSHNVALRKRALEEGLTVNEYGVFVVPEGTDPDELDRDEAERVAGETEEEVYDAVGLAWVPPEMREDRGELELAAEGELPEPSTTTATWTASG